MSGLAPEAIVIGASAGALDVLSNLLPALPSDYRLPILVVVHLPPDKTSLFAELIRARCAIRVREAEDKEPIEPGVAYFAPPDYHLLVEQDKRLSLSDDEPVLFSRPSIDVLFESAADAYGGGLIGVVLTGANSDGANGLKAVVEAGGVAVVQESGERLCGRDAAGRYRGLPRCSRSAGERDRRVSAGGWSPMTSEIGPVYFLLVDDLEENLLSLEGLLRRDGLVLLKARSGPQALELLLQYDVALAILDVQMPEMDGYELAELMRGTERTRRAPIIFLTAGAADRQRRFRGYEAGAVDFLNKPIEPDILRSKASVFFELYQQRNQIAAQRDELKSYAAALTEADRRKDEFLATLAHELRNPLAPIRNGLDILRTSPTAPNAEEIRDVMDRQLSHLVRLVDDLLDVSRVSQGKIDLRKARVALSDVIKTAVDASNPLIIAGRHELKLDMPEAPVWLDADLMRLSQVVSNLLNNAAKYTPEGGTIVLSTRREGEEAVVTVSDNGVGIPSDMLPRVFDLFTQVRDNLDRSRGGLGIGLALVKQLVEMHGGSITAESAGPGKGSAFRLRLPVMEFAPASSDVTEPDSTSGATEWLR